MVGNYIIMKGQNSFLIGIKYDNGALYFDFGLYTEAKRFEYYIADDYVKMMEFILKVPFSIVNINDIF